MKREEEGVMGSLEEEKGCGFYLPTCCYVPAVLYRYYTQPTYYYYYLPTGLFPHYYGCIRWISYGWIPFHTLWVTLLVPFSFLPFVLYLLIDWITNASGFCLPHFGSGFIPAVSIPSSPYITARLVRQEKLRFRLLLKSFYVVSSFHTCSSSSPPTIPTTPLPTF